MFTFGWKKAREVELVPEGPGPEGGEGEAAAAAAAAAGAGGPGPSRRGEVSRQGSAETGGLSVGTPVGSTELPCSALLGPHSSCGSFSSDTPEAASVRQRAQFFEALIRSNTDTLIRCSQSEVHTMREHPSGGSVDMDLGSEQSDSDSEPWQEYSEVKLVLRVPKAAQPSGSGRGGKASSSSHPQYGSTEEMAALIEQLQAQLVVKDREKQLTANALARKTQECDNLMRVVRELADSRAKVVCTKANLQEKYVELQSEYHRTLRIAELSRIVSKENLAKTSRTQKALRQTEDELHSTRKQAAHLQTKSKKLRVENCQLKEKLSLLERLDVFEGVQESACMREFTRYRVCETY